MTTPVTLSRIHPDYAQIVAQLRTALSTKDSWKDIVETATGEAIISFIAAVGDYSQFSIEQAFKEAFLDYARKPSSIYAAARHLGVRVGRKTPAYTKATLTRTNSSTAITLPPYSQFSFGNTLLFSRLGVVFPIGVDTVNDVDLYEGEVKLFNATSDGSDYQQFVTLEGEFTVSDNDVNVYVDFISVPVLKNGLWHAKNSPGVQDKTTADGELQLLFGSLAGGAANYGSVPPISSTILIVYAVTSGAAGNDASVSGSRITYLADTDFTGTLTSGLIGGEDERNALFYKKFSPLLFASNKGATTKSDFAAVAASYPGVFDAIVIGQHELSPTDNRYMNLVRVSLLTDPVFTSTQWNEFADYYRQLITYPIRFYREDPVPVLVNVDCTVSCFNQADLSVVQANILQALTDLFALQSGIISRNFYQSDIYSSIKTADQRIDYVQLTSPSTDVFPNLSPPEEPSLTENLASGTLSVGTYSYVVTATNSYGETLAVNYAILTTTVAGSAISISWNPISGATGYKLYGRTSPHGLLATTVSTTFVDNGSVIPGASVPILDTSGVHYAKLGTVNITMRYSGRVS